jgi:hypothetical protein
VIINVQLRFVPGIFRQDKLPVLNNQLGVIINVQLRFVPGIFRQDKLPVTEHLQSHQADY